ncbi:hypothetical protein B0H11DRAFT_1931143 [Mycena galericulata]|nr:hypothetical protein B0H11DRAFT_1931143 [Mycena galericulata]
MNRANPSPAKARADRQLLQGMADASQPCWWKPATLGSSIDPNGLPRAFLFGYVVDEILTPEGRHLILGVPVYNGSTVNTTWMKNSFKRQVRGIHWAQSSNNGSLVYTYLRASSYLNLSLLPRVLQWMTNQNRTPLTDPLGRCYTFFACTFYAEDRGNDSGLPWPEVPKELQSEMLANFDLESLTSTAATCTELHTTSNHIMEGHLTRCFSLWDLNWLSIRFMLVQTESLVAGLWAHHLLFPNRVCRLKKTDILEFFVRSQAERGVIRYFEAASSWEQVKSDTPASVMKFLEGAVLLQHKDRNRFPQYIALHISGDIPGLAIYRQPLTSMFVSMSGNGIQVPYADLTFGNLSMVNHEFGGELSTSEGKNDMHNLFRRTNEAGITIVAYHSTSDGKGYRSGWGNGTDTWLDEDYIDSLDSIIRAQ